MKNALTIVGVAVLIIFAGYVGAQVASDTKPEYQTDPTPTLNNCNILAVKNLQASTTELDLSRQQVDINTAHSFEELAKLGATC